MVMHTLVKLYWYIMYWRPRTVWIRLPIMFAVATVIPILTHYTLAQRFHHIQAAEFTFLLMIPVAAWLMQKHSQGWLDDSEDK
jgi:hypothetical protein